MAVLDQYSYIFGIAICFAFLDAWNIGANDVANSFATSVSSRSLTLIQAMCIAAVMEFVGAILAGSRTTGTIKSDIISIERFESEPSVLMLGMLCALIGSSLFLTFATRIGLPVSTTHCIIGGIIGIGFATIGANGIDWSFEGVSQVFAAWGIAPAIAGSFGAILFLFTNFVVMRAKNPLRVGMLTVPFFFGLTSGICTMLIVWKGAANLDLDDWGTAPTAGTIFGVAGGVGVCSIVFLLPYLHVKLVREDWQVKPWQIIMGPLLLRRPAPPPMPQGTELIPNYYRGHLTREELEAQGSNMSQETRTDEESMSKHHIRTGEKDAGSSSESDRDVIVPDETKVQAAIAGAQGHDTTLTTTQGHWWEPLNLLKSVKYAFFRGVKMEVVEAQGGKGKDMKFIQKLLVGKGLEDKHARVKHFDNKVEHLYSFLQVATAMTASFAHGANDVSNAMGPLSAIYNIWNTGTTGEDSPVPIWVLIFGGAAITIGLWTYGYNIMRNLGNRITLHSPSRGFCMELGAAITVVIATRLSLPVSTTQCIVGATVGVGLCAGDFKAINWRMVVWTYMGWFITLPCTAIISGCLMGFIINAPQFGNAV